ncbi:putative methyltransferase tdiE [Colletotrichum shisoi]|uniref:Putative methyltransferase tdiE n=1 Tax=Colletotrichum shisoi TaxID=2078593 RepID=A0A5Q4BCY0_9PEZI|nr:putative methyltransferase tdiE [Colletotrichum shisoi]
MDKHSLQRLRKSGRSDSPVGRLPLRQSTAANSVSAAPTSTRLTASSSLERTRNPSTESDGRPRTPPSSTRPSMNSGQQDDYADDHPSPTSDEVSRALWAGASDSDDGSDDGAPAVSFRTATPVDVCVPVKVPKTLVKMVVNTATKKNPNCAVVGIDIEKVRPPYSAPNCQFRIMDATANWALNKQFDYVHVRMLGDIVDKERFIQSIYDQLNPGGWVEFTEWIPVLQSPDRSLDGTSFQKWNRLLGQGLENMGRDIRYVQEYRPLLEKAGFERMKLTKHAAPTNPCYPGKKCQLFGAMMVSNWNAIIEPLSVPVFTIGLGWSEAQVQVLLKKVRKEIGDTRYHSFMTL